MWWKLEGIFFSMEFGILSGLGILLLAKFLDISCMFLGQNMCIGGFGGFRVCL